MNKLTRLLAVIFFLTTLYASAQQLVGGEISYKCQSGDTYLVTVSLYAKCPSPSLSSSIQLFYISPSENLNNQLTATMNQTGSDVTINACFGQTNKCNGGTGEASDAVIKRTYSTLITLPRARKDWTLSILEGPRASLNALVPQVENMYLEAKINNFDVKCNNSPTFPSSPPLFSSSKQTVTYQSGISDVDGDKLNFALITPKRAKNTTVTYISPYSATQPVMTSGAFGFDVNTGNMTFTPNKQGDMSVTTMQVTETRNNIEIGYVMREMYFQTLSEQTSPPFFQGQDTLKFCSGGVIKISYKGGTNETGVPLDIIWNNQSDWTGIVIDSPSVIKGNQSAIFQMNANAASPFVKRLDLTLVDNNCGRVTKTVIVQVFSKPSLRFNVTKDTLVTCIDPAKPIILKAIVAGGSGRFSYKWANLTSTSNSIPITSVGKYSATVTDLSNNCVDTASRVISSPIDFNFDKYCTDLNTVFYDVSAVAGPFSYLYKQPMPLSTTKHWKWTYTDGTNVVIDTNATGTHKFSKKGSYKVKLETSDGKSKCVGSIEKSVFICGKPPVDFIFTDTCVKTERSDLKVFDLVKDTSLCPITDLSKIRFYVNGVFRASANDSRYPTSLNINTPGLYIVKLVAQNNAGCSDSITKKITVHDKPKVTRSADDYFYRCDKGFPDTSFTFTGQTVLTDTLSTSKIQTLTVSRTGYSDTTKTTTTLGSITVPFHITQNQQSVINFSVRDGYSCTNDTSIVIGDPITPNMVLTKYYCFLNDTLKLQDLTYPSGYNWGLKKSTWNMQDGTVDTTLGFVNHVYTLASLDQAIIKLVVEDKTGCKDSVQGLQNPDGTFGKPVYLSKPDTSNFQIKAPLACFADTVRIFGIKGKYINSWFYRYRSNPSAIYDTADKFIYNKAFGISFPANIDTTQFYTSNQYDATTAIFYNESDTTKNFVKNAFGQNVVPKVPTQVCHVSVTRHWKVVERLKYIISDNYNHCYDSTKIFKATLSPKDTLVHSAVLDTTSFTWTLYSPKQIQLDQQSLSKNASLIYAPSLSLFPDTATATQSRGIETYLKYPPYNLKVKYSYFSGGITCNDTASLFVGNERVIAQIDSAPSTFCLNYTKGLSLVSTTFLLANEQDSTIWNIGDGSLPYKRGRLVPAAYKKDSVYVVKAYAKNQYGCPDTVSFKFTVLPSPVAKLSIAPVCFGNNSVLDADSSKPTPGSRITNYYWYFGNKIYKQLDHPAVPGDTTEPNTDLASLITDTGIVLKQFPATQNVGLVVRDANGCYDETGIKTAIVNPLPISSFTAKTVENNDEDYLGNEPISFDATTENVTTWTWNMGNGQVLSSPVGASQYDINYTYPYYAPPYPTEKNIYTVTLKVETAGGCIDSMTKRIDVNVYFVLPNAFSPNDDGLHDQLLGVGKGIKEMKEFKIFNRWGEVVHTFSGKPEKDDARRGYLLWDGKYKGESQPVGAYVYYAVVKTGYGEELIFKGNLALLK